MQAEGEIKMLRESSCASWSPRCGAVGAGPALLKGKPGPQGREGREFRRLRPLRSALTSGGGPGGPRRKWEEIYASPVSRVLEVWSGCGSEADVGMKV
ncbi:Hypothetical predicted protein [Lynx pardinus]|uniref:Uncharacterized protein n=1 Tax=Lynx pardinus TaxID=191816 RepID=A0A485MS78_LYNPA|nr:Hypothetical predicted protein [Lynx pardinus]